MSAPATYMQRALELARRGLYGTDPNPRVGCVLVQAGRIVGEGWHERAGGPHAEVQALRAAGALARGATAYVTLEPCAHTGRTPPCTVALIEAQVARVIYASADPNPLVNGAGGQALRAAGVQVEQGLLEEEARELNPGFFRRMRDGLPWVRVKLAASLDGRTALADGRSRWITGEAARQDVQHFRARSSAVLTGAGTVVADDPQLNVRLPGIERQPLRVVLDPALRTDPRARLYARDPSAGRVLVFTASEDAGRRRALEQQGIEVESVAVEADGRLALGPILRRLAAREINELWVEAGATLAGAFVADGLVDELILYLAARVLGPQARALLQIPEPASLAAAPRLRFSECVSMGEDLRLRLRAMPVAASD